MHCCSPKMHLPVSIPIRQWHKQWHRLISNHVSYPTDSPKANRLGLCNSLFMLGMILIKCLNLMTIYTDIGAVSLHLARSQSKFSWFLIFINIETISFILYCSLCKKSEDGSPPGMRRHHIISNTNCTVDKSTLNTWSNSHVHENSFGSATK